MAIICIHPLVNRISLLSILFICFFSTAKSTGWEALNGPTGYFSTQSIIYHQGAWFASSNINGSMGTGVWKSTSNGLSWSNLASGLPKPYARDFASFNLDLFVACDTGVYRTSNGGLTWTNADQGLPDFTSVYELEVHNGNLYACVFFGNGNVELFYLTGATANWVSTGYTFSFLASPNQLYSNGNVLWAATQAGVYKSTDNGVTFNYFGNNIPFNASITSIIAKGDTAYCGTTNGSYFTTDGGQMWMPINIPALGSPLYTYCWKIVGNTVFAGFTNQGIYETSIGQTNFTVFGTGYLTNNLAWQMASDGNYLFAATSEGIYSCLINGGNWQQQNGNITRARTRIIYCGNGVILAGVGAFSGVHRSTDGGLTWSSAGLQNQFRIFNRGLESNGRIFLPSNNGLHYTDDGGITFTAITTTPIPSSEIRRYGNTLISCGGNSVLQSTDNGSTWSTLGNGMPTQITVNCINTNGSKVYAGTSNGVYSYDPMTNFWTNYSQGLTPPLSVNEIEVTNLTLVINTFQSVYKRSPSDTIWRPGSMNSFFNDMLTLNGFIFAAGSNGISYSDDAGKTFRPYNDSLPATIGAAENLFSTSNSLFCGMQEYSAWRRVVNKSMFPYGNIPFEICAGDSFTINGINTSSVNPGNKYILQLSDKDGDFYNFTAMDSIISTSVTFTMTARIPSGLTAGSTYRMRIVSTSPYLLSAIYENPLNITAKPVITLQPATQNTCSGISTGFFTDASSDQCIYQWQVDMTGSGSFINLTNNTTYQGVDSNLLLIQNPLLSMNGYKYRCIIFHPCTTLTTNQATLNINALTPIQQQPVNDTLCLGDGSSFSVTTPSPGNTYQWQSSIGSGFTNLSTSGGQYSGVNSPTLVVNFTQSQDVNRTYRCLINGCTPTDTVQLIINAIPSTYTLPSALPYCDGADLTLQVQYSGTGLTYQWEQDNGAGFITLNNDIYHQGVNTNQLLLTAIPASFNNYQYRCKVNGQCLPDSSYSTTTQLSLNSSPIIVLQPANETICENDTALFAVAASGSYLNYSWEVNDGTGWQPLPPLNNFNGVNTSTLTIANTPLYLNNYQFRCNLSGCVTTQAALLNVKAAPQVTAPSIFWCALFMNIPLTAATPPGGTYYGNYIINDFFVYNEPFNYIQTSYDYIYTAPNGCTGSAGNIIFVGECGGTAESGSFTSSIDLYPNPANHQVTIRNDNGSTVLNATVGIYDINGRLQREIKGLSITTSYTLDITDLPAGLYLVRLLTADQTQSAKLLISR